MKGRQSAGFGLIAGLSLLFIQGVPTQGSEQTQYRGQLLHSAGILSESGTSNSSGPFDPAPFSEYTTLTSLPRPIDGPPPRGSATTIPDSGPVIDTFFVDMYEAADDGMVGPYFGNVSLIAGEDYLVTITGTYSLWSASQWGPWTGSNALNACGGQAEELPVFPSAATTNGAVSHDSAFVFAFPEGSTLCQFGDSLPFLWHLRQFSLDGGDTFEDVNPLNDNFNSNHLYTYLVQGEGHPLGIAEPDPVTSDNYGVLRVEIQLAADASNVDLWVDHIEVAQVMLDDSVKLIAEKLTLVRVYVGVSGASSVANVSGILHVEDDKGNQQQIDWSWPWPTVLAKSDPEPLILRDTLNFLIVPWKAGEFTFWAEVDPENRIPESNESNNNNISEKLQKTFQAGQKLRIAWVAMRYAPSFPPGLIHNPDLSIMTTGTRSLRKLLPVGINDVTYFFQPTVGAAPSDLLVMDVKFSEDTDVQYLQKLRTLRQITTRENGWIFGQPPDFLYGWVPEEAETGLLSRLCGVAYIGGRVAAGLATDDCFGDTGAEIMAHEIGHNIGLKHAPGCGAKNIDNDYPDRTDWPAYPLGSIGVWGLDSYTPNTLYSPQDTYDFMSYCDPVWVSQYNYGNLSQLLTQRTPEHLLSEALSTPEPQILVSGLIKSTPTLDVTFGTFYPISSSLPPDVNTGTDYCLELRNALQELLDSRCIDLTFASPETGEPKETDAFTLVLPYPAGTRAVVLTYKGSEVGRVTASDNPPSVLLTEPNGGETWGATETHTVAWSASDPDGDSLSFIVSYSPDDGASWLPLAFDVTGSSLVIDSSILPGSPNARFRVVATDQFNSAEDISDAPFVVESKGPQALILTPQDNARIPPSTPLILEGYAFDLEDANLAGSALEWSSSLDGLLGIGSSVLANLSPGSHDITFVATDSDGNIGTDGVNVKTYTFEDAPPDHWAWKFIEGIYAAGLTVGFPDGTYRPDNPVTRAEMAVFIKKGIHGSTYSPPAADGSHPFSDIAGHWAEEWIEDLYDEGFTSGFPDGTYRPQNNVTRAEMAVFLKKAIHGSAYTSPAPDGSHPFSDIGGHWAEAWIEDLYDEGITSGYPDGTYRPENQVTRAEMAVFLVNAFSLALP